MECGKTSDRNAHIRALTLHRHNQSDHYVRNHLQHFHRFISASVLQRLSKSKMIEGEAISQLVYKKQPKTLQQIKLRDYQLVGLNWMLDRYSHGLPAILADEMGLGKTIQTIAFLSCLKESGMNGPFLIVVPLGVVDNWIVEIETFCPSLRCVKFHGSSKYRQHLRKRILHELDDIDCIVTTYEMIVSSQNFFTSRLCFSVCVFDEAHRLKNSETLQRKVSRKITAAMLLFLTGTPLQNNLIELWSLLNLLLPHIFVDSSLFSRCFQLGDKNSVDVQGLIALKGMLKHLSLRRLKAEVELSLPQKTEIRIYAPLSPIQTRAYQRQLVCNIDLLLENKDENVQRSDMKLTNLLMCLRMICNHPFQNPNCVENKQFTDDPKKVLVASGKLMILDHLVQKLLHEKHKILIFSCFTSMLDIIEEHCYYRGWHTFRLDGQVGRVKRVFDIREFNSNRSEASIYLLSTVAGGLGINLQAADRVILYDSHYNPQVDQQAMSRTHRIGQKNPVTVYRLVTQGSVEERMVSRAQRKLFLGAVVDPGHKDEESYQSPSDLLATVRFGANQIIRPKGTFAFENEKMFIREFNKSIDQILTGSRFASDKNNEAEFSAEKFNFNTLPPHLRKFCGKVYKKPRGTSTEENWIKDLNARCTINPKTGRLCRKRESTCVQIGQDYVLKKNLPEPTAKKRKVLKKKSILHQNYCYVCGEKEAELLECFFCPQTQHQHCLKNSWKSGLFTCEQHRCSECNIGHSGSGCILVCVQCPKSYCETHIPESARKARRFELESLSAYMDSYPNSFYFINCCESTKASEESIHNRCNSSIEISIKAEKKMDLFGDVENHAMRN